MKSSPLVPSKAPPQPDGILKKLSKEDAAIAAAAVKKKRIPISMITIALGVPRSAPPRRLAMPSSVGADYAGNVGSVSSLTYST